MFPVGEAVFPLAENWFPSAKIIFPLAESIFPLAENWFPSAKTMFPLAESIFPLAETAFPLWETIFPLAETAFPLWKTVFPLAESMLGARTNFRFRNMFARGPDHVWARCVYFATILIHTICVPFPKFVFQNFDFQILQTRNLPKTRTGTHVEKNKRNRPPAPR